MLCPRCSEVLKTHLIHTVEIDECLQCRGTWFDQAELRKAKDAVEPDLRWMDFDIWKHEDRLRVSSTALQCPKCNVRMAAITYGGTGVEVDYCSQCQGIWLDGGEFDKIINALEEELVTKSVPDYVETSLEEAREVIRGPEGPVSEWRDLLTVVRLFQYRVLVEKPEFRAALAAIQRGT